MSHAAIQHPPAPVMTNEPPMITEAQIDALREGDCDILPLLLRQPQGIHRLPTHLRQALVVALLSVIGGSRNAFTTGVKKESATAMRIIVNLATSPSSLESTSELKVMFRTLGVDELRKLRLDRHLLSAKDDMTPAAIEFVKTMTHVLRCDPAEIITNPAALAKLQQTLQVMQEGQSVRQPGVAATNSAETLRRDSSARQGPSSQQSSSQSQNPNPPDAQQQQQAQASSSGGTASAPAAGPNAPSGGTSHRVRALPSKPSSVPHEQNPMFDAALQCGLMPVHTPNPVLLFAKHFGLGCIPRIPRYSEGTSLVLAVPNRKSSQSSSQSSDPTPTAEAPTAATTTTVTTASNIASVPQQPAVAAPMHTPTSAPSTPAVAPTSPIPPIASGSFVSSPTPTHQLPRSPLAAPANNMPPPPASPPRAPPNPPATQPIVPSSLSQPSSPQRAGSSNNLSSLSQPHLQSQTTIRVPALHTGGAAATPNTAADSASAGNVSPTPGASPSGVTAVLPPPLEEGSPAFKLLARYTRSSEGVVVGWGQNRCGELGLGTNQTQPVYTPRVIPIQEKVTQISSGAQYSLMLSDRGRVMSCGAAEWGQLGIGDPNKLSEVSDDIPISTVPSAIRSFKPNDVIAQVCAGYAFAVGITENGEMYLWGNNNHGQCSLGMQLKPENIRVIQPVKVGMRGTRVVSVATGSFFVVILTSVGTVLSWGLVSVLGLGQEEDVLRMIDRKWCAESLSREKRNIVLCPCKIPGLDTKGIVQVCAGQWHVLAVGADGAVYSWGVGHQGRLGHGVASQETKPRRIEGLKDVHVIQASCGSFHSCVLTSDGRTFVFGDNANQQCGLSGQPFYLSPTLLPLPSPALQVACGREHTTILLQDGDVVVCGAGVATGYGLGGGSRCMAPTRVLTNFITLGLNCGINHSFAMAVPRALELIPVGTLHAGPPSKITTMMLKDGLISAALGANFTVVVNRNGETFAFGNGDWGQLGMGSTALLLEKSAVDTTPVILHPVRIPELATHRVASVAAGYAFAFAITESQRVYFWGNNNHSQGGLGPDMRSSIRIESPTEVVALSDKQVVQIACGSFFVLALTATMEVFGWGITDCCGHGKDGCDAPPELIATSTSSEARPVVCAPTKIASLSNIISIAAGQWHALALADKGHIYAWGVGHQGRLGTGDGLPRFTPTRLSISLTCVSIGCGSFHSFALTAGGHLYMWGDNDSGQCGTDRVDTITYPQQVATDVRHVSCGRQHSIVITNDGKVRMAGLLVHHEKQYKCRNFDAQPQPPPLAALTSSTQKFALQSFSGPHHTFILAEKDRPAPRVVQDAVAEFARLARRATAANSNSNNNS